MKRIFLLLAAFVLCYAQSQAQTGLHINKAFRGEVVPQQRMVDTRVRGKTLSSYRLTLFHSLRMKPTDDEQSQLAALMDMDAKDALHNEQTKRIVTSTQLLQLQPKNGQNRFLCYKRTTEETTIIYMEGWLESLEQLKEILNDK